MVPYPVDLAYVDLFQYAKAELTLGVYEIKSGFHQDREKTGVLTLNLQKQLYSLPSLKPYGNKGKRHGQAERRLWAEGCT